MTTKSQTNKEKETKKKKKKGKREGREAGRDMRLRRTEATSGRRASTAQNSSPVFISWGEKKGKWAFMNIYIE